MVMRSMAALSLALTLAASGQYDWSAVSLHPDPAIRSYGNAVYGAHQGGTATIAGAPVPVLWSGSHQDWVDLRPAWALAGGINGMSENAQVGQVIPGANQYHAGVWYGTPESAVDLHPLSAYRASEAYAVSGNIQVGIATHTQSGQLHASLWKGSAESFVDLHPAGSSQSRGLATDGTLQGGWASLPGGGDHEAVIWAGSAESVVNLAPPGAQRSAVLAMAPGIQVGSVEFPDEAPHAAIWRGTADSWVDLNPQDSTWSEILGTDGRYHAGQAYVGGFPHAHLWLPDGGTVDLHSYLPLNYTYSEARDVYTDGSHIYVVGMGAASGDISAWMWVGTVPSPSPATALIIAGSLAASRRRGR
jgi:hypothetical protein